MKSRRLEWVRYRTEIRKGNHAFALLSGVLRALCLASALGLPASRIIY